MKYSQKEGKFSATQVLTCNEKLKEETREFTFSYSFYVKRLEKMKKVQYEFPK